MQSPRWDETWHRLREWTAGQGPSERLAAQILLADGYADLDPSHPLGGRDGGKDAICSKNGATWIMGVYFPRGQQKFTDIKNKFSHDLLGVNKNGARGMCFLTNQELTLSERQELKNIDSNIYVEIYHLERITALLDSPPMSAIRRQFLGIQENDGDAIKEIQKIKEQMEIDKKHLESIQTGGDTFCYFMLYHFDLSKSIAHHPTIIRIGGYPIYDLRLRIHDLDTSRDMFSHSWGNLISPAEFLYHNWQLADTVYYRIFFQARNGGWHQDLILKKSVAANCWLAATQVKARNGHDIVFTHMDHEFQAEFGTPIWRP